MKLSLHAKNHDIAELMLNFLSFNPFFRMTSFESLSQCRLFDSVRDKKKEQFLQRMMQVNREDVAKSTRQDRLRTALRMSKQSQMSKETRDSRPGEQGMGFPSFPIIELPIDSIEAFDYENAENAKYSVDDLRSILIEEIKHYRVKRDDHSSMDFKKVVPTSVKGSLVYRGSKSP
uniref:Uncharacterized protein n=1 Tax=Strombidium inclinatum TaxID=197538 RepID=A0A7S3IS19_9SPIT|mmetsp:Transcript_363/g.299  ORF Transcript_363/g.299 Transcript_363/m.299 type:complete len:175 (+) Transcript_363:2778-3302(+)